MLAHYDKAKIYLEEAMTLAEEPDQRFAIRYWAVLACSNLGQKETIASLLKDFDIQETMGENQAYCKPLQLFAECCELDAMIRFINTESNDREYVTALYAVCVWLESNMRWGEAAELRQNFSHEIETGIALPILQQRQMQIGEI